MTFLHTRSICNSRGCIWSLRYPISSVFRRCIRATHELHGKWLLQAIRMQPFPSDIWKMIKSSNLWSGFVRNIHKNAIQFTLLIFRVQRSAWSTAHLSCGTSNTMWQMLLPTPFRPEPIQRKLPRRNQTRWMPTMEMILIRRFAVNYCIELNRLLY